MLKRRKIAVVGSGGHAITVLEAAELAGFLPYGVIDLKHNNSRLSHLPLFSDAAQINLNKIDLCLGIGTNFLREQLFLLIKKAHPNANFPPIIHPSSAVSDSASISEGVVVLAQAFIGPTSTLETGSLVNTAASLEHGSLLKNFSSLGPGARTGGNVKIGQRTMVGINSCVIQEIEIGADTVIGAQSLVLDKIGNFSVVFGSPGKFIRSRKKDEPYY